LTQLLGKLAVEALTNPQGLAALEQIANQLFSPCHTAADVAQDALDAWEHGQLSTEACRKIVEAVLEDRIAKARPVQQQPAQTDLAALLKQLSRN
jgi:hypothetical protein